MSELKLTQHPEITELLSVLEQNGLHKEQDEVKSLATYIDEMEGQLSAMNEELMQMHREISTIRDSSLKVRCEKLISSAEKQLRQAATAIRTVKHNCLCMARNAVDTFKANGKAALRRAAFAMKIPSTLALLQDMLERQAASAQKTAERLGDIQAELQEAGTHIQRAGRTLLGRPEPEDAEYAESIEIEFKSDDDKDERLKKAIQNADQLMDQLRLISVHRGKPLPSIKFDSSGTKKIVALASYIVEALEKGKILIIDELDSGLQFKISREIISLFNNYINASAQLICTTHDVSLLDIKTLFRKDQIWFTDKDIHQAYLYSLAQFTAEKDGVRSESDIIDKYSKGAFGALPDPSLVEALLSVSEEGE